MRKLIIGLITMAVFSLIAPALSMADTINVPVDYTTIQAAIDAAVPGETVQVAAGSYIENITLKSGVIVQGAGASVTTIQGTGSGPVVTANNVDSNAKIDGFTITGGRNHNEGGGIEVLYSSLSITNNTIKGNRSNSGGGIGMLWSSPTIANNTIKENSSTNPGYGGYAGGIYNNQSSSVITNNTIMGNSGAEWGGGIYIGGLSSAIITNNTITGNSTTPRPGGNDGGGGIYISGSNSAIITNNTITGNSSIYGGGITCYASSPTITNNIIWGNGLDVVGCSPTYSDVGNPVLGGTNIAADPMFVDSSSGDYHLQSGSPAIDVGSNSAPSLPGTDFEGDPRIVNGIVDIGADEVMEFVKCTGFEPPMDTLVSVKKKNRVLPLKMELWDKEGAAITDLEINAPPVVEVDFSGSGPATDPEDVYLPAGKGDEGNQFVFTGINWQFNLVTKNFSGPGTYTIRAISGNSNAYIIDPTCTSIFIIEK